MEEKNEIVSLVIFSLLSFTSFLFFGESLKNNKCVLSFVFSQKNERKIEGSKYTTVIKIKVSKSL